MTLRSRSTPDLVVLMLTAVVMFVIVLVSVVGVVGLLIGHAADVKDLIATIGELVGSVLAIIVGYVGGRGASAISSNDKEKP